MDKRKQDKFDKTGILMPLLMYRWRIIFPNQSKGDGDMITTNAVKLAIDYATSELRITVRQDLYSATFHKIFSRMMKTITNRNGKKIAPLGSDQVILIESLDGSSANATAVLELNCSPKSHTFELNYEDGDNVAEHRLTFAINSVTDYNEIEITEEKEKQHDS